MGVGSGNHGCGLQPDHASPPSQSALRWYRFSPSSKKTRQEAPPNNRLQRTALRAAGKPETLSGKTPADVVVSAMEKGGWSATVEITGTPGEFYEQHMVPAIVARWTAELVGVMGVRAGERVLDPVVLIGD